MISKRQIIEVIEAMPEEEFTDVELVIEEIVLLEKIKKGLAAMEKSEVLSEDQVDKLSEEW
ncbi:hypothetical protein [Parafilimonas terrae]|uniref:Uncharacterized protein n=1 Tax=Parafilimonas terrae TaxID=1465490 RepID=A0A1I5VQ78_9BACT|nr:hypothetical protein [Parafilimonas terrae]SFQ09146.1 hypothetical protein SAMN05444277_105104 [Parafilimonas terrae]